MRHALLAAVAVVALALPGIAFGATATHGSTAQKAHKPLGIVPGFIRTPGSGPGKGQRVVRGALRAASDGPAAGDNLTYNGPDQIPPASLKTLPRVMEGSNGPVTIYTIFWQPSGFRTAANYQDTVNGFFQRVADASLQGDTPWDTTGQYYDDYTGISNRVAFGDTTQDYTHFPKSGCKTPANVGGSHFTVVGAQVCLTDAQIQAEVKAVATRMGWPHGPDVQFFMYTPHNVESCAGTDCSYSSYCAYHWFFGTTPSTEYIYANMPWPNQAFTANGNRYASDCDSGEHPNGGGGQTTGSEPGYPSDADAADEVINVSSHESNEAITDPTGLGWWVDSATSPYGLSSGGYENGDLCAWWWPTNTGTGLGGQSGNGALYTNSIGGKSYFIQGEWSNIDATASGNSGCQWSHEYPSFDETAPPTIAEHGTLSPVGVPLHASAGTYDVGKGAVYDYYWIRCNASEITAAARRALRAHNWAGAPGCADPVAEHLFGTASGAPNGAATDTYTPTAADVGDYIFFCAGAFDGWSDGNGDCSIFYENPVKISGEPELNVEPNPSWLTVSAGTFQPGSKVTLSIPHDGFTSTAASFSVQWQHCLDGYCQPSGKPVTVPAKATGATTAQYTVQPADTGTLIEATIVAKNKAGSSDPAATAATTTVTGSPAASTDSPPSWADSVWHVGTPATINVGAWTAPAAAPITGFTITIYRCPSALPMLGNCEVSATLPVAATLNGHTTAYTPAAADAGQYLVALIAANSKWTVGGFADNQQLIVTSGAVDGIPAHTGDGSLTVSALGTLTPLDGSAVYALNMDDGGWTNTPEQYRYTVYRCTSPSDVTTCVNMNGVSGGASGRVRPSSGSAIANYVPTGDEAGFYIRFAAQAINANGFSAPVWSAPGVDTIPSNTGVPTVTLNDDGLGYDIHPGTWDGNAVSYANVIATCTDNTSTDHCTLVDEKDSIGSATPEYKPAVAFGSSLYVRVLTFALNNDSLSAPVWSDAVAVHQPPLA